MKKFLILCFLLATLPLRAEKTVVALITDKTTVGAGTLIVSSGTDAAGSSYVFQISRLNGFASVAIEESVNGGAWFSVGTMTALGAIVTVPASGNGAFRANVKSCTVDTGDTISAYTGSCVVSVVGTASGAPVLTVLTPTATAAATNTPTKTATPTPTATSTVRATLTPTPTGTPIVNPTPPPTPTPITGQTPAPTRTATPTVTPTVTPTRTPTITPTPT